GKRGRRRARAEKLGKNPNGMHLPLGLMSLMPWGWAYGRVNRWAHGSLWRQWAPTLVAFLIGLIENGLIRLVVIIILAVIAHDNPHILLPTFAAIFAVLHFDGIYWGQETETREVRWRKVFIGYGLGSLLLGYAGYYLLPDNPLLNKLFAAWSHWIAQYVPAPPSLELASFERYITVSLFAGLVHAVYDPIARWIGLPLGIATGRPGSKGGAPGTRSGSLAPEEVKKLRGILLSWRGELNKFKILMKYL